MSDFLLKGQPLSVRHDGSLMNLGDWSLEVAEEMARREALSLTEDHWNVLNVMREYYGEYNIAPIRKLLLKEVAEKFESKKYDVKFLDDLFPKGLIAQGTKMAGVPMPLLDAEIDSATHIQAVPSEKKNHFVHKFEFEGETVNVYPTGHLVDTSQWRDSMATFMAKQEGIELTAEHREVIAFLRTFYGKYGIVPMVRLLRKHMRQQLGESKSSKSYLYDLFPAGPAQQGSRIAGLPAPQGCIDV